MKKIAMIAAFAAVFGCAKSQNGAADFQTEVNEKGLMSVRVKFEDPATRAQTGYLTALEVEKKVNKVDILVFDQATGALNAIKRVTGMETECQMSLPVGKKEVYAIVNGPDPEGVTVVSDLGNLMDRFSESGMENVGLTLVGNTEYEVKSEQTDGTAVITVGWLVARVVLSRVECNIPAQYGSMKVDCVYLGNANTAQAFAGVADEMVNIDGRSADYEPIGQGGVIGAFGSYLYREIGTDVYVNDAMTDKYHMYCQPNGTDTCTCLYLLTTIGENQYYYRVPLTEGLEANTTCSVELKITNLGSPEPPTDDLQKGNIEATIAFQDWIPGPSYVEEF